MNNEQAKCELCGEPMPEGEEMFVYHGYSGPCPNPPLPPQEEPWVAEFQTVCEEISVRYDEPVYGHAIIKSFIQKTLEADREERAGGGGNVM